METQNRHIHFNNVVVTHIMVTYSYAYKCSRISKWEQLARDRSRFQRRIKDTETTLIKVFNPHHRDAVWALRENHVSF